MSGPLAGMVWNARIPQLPGSYKALLARIADMCDDNGVPVRTRSQRFIAEDLNVSRSTVKRGVKYFRTLGLIYVERPSSDAYKRNRYAISILTLARFVDERARPEYIRNMMIVEQSIARDLSHHEPTAGSYRSLAGAAKGPSNNTFKSNNSFRRPYVKQTAAQAMEHSKAMEASKAETSKIARLMGWVIDGVWPADQGPSPEDENWRSGGVERKFLQFVSIALDGHGSGRIRTPVQQRIIQALETPSLQQAVRSRIAHLEQTLS